MGGNRVQRYAGKAESIDRGGTESRDMVGNRVQRYGEKQSPEIGGKAESKGVGKIESRDMRGKQSPEIGRKQSPAIWGEHRVQRYDGNKESRYMMGT